MNANTPSSNENTLANRKIVKRENEPDTIIVQTKDNEMNWAMEKALLTINYFISCLSNPRSGQTYFSVKARIEDDGQTEHIWLTEVSYDNHLFYGKVANTPVNVTNVSIGKEIGIDLKHVSDWMIIDKGRLIGGYTIRTLRDQMSVSEKASFDKECGFVIDFGEDYFDHNFFTPEGAILCLEDAYLEQDLEKAVACKSFKDEAKLMLEDFPQIKNNQELLTKTTQTLELAYRKSIKKEGFPDFKKVKRAFPKRQFLNEHLVIVTEVCIFPDHTYSEQQLHVCRTSEGWRVLNPVS